MMTDLDKNPGGRPTIYKEEFCDLVIPLLKQGMSIEEIGLELDVGYSTIYRWMDDHEKFREAIKKGREYSKAWWMRKGRTELENQKFSSTLWYMNMKNRFGWMDKQEINQNNEHNINIEDVKERAKEAERILNDKEKKY